MLKLIISKEKLISGNGEVQSCFMGVSELSEDKDHLRWGNCEARVLGTLFTWTLNSPEMVVQPETYGFSEQEEKYTQLHETQQQEF